ncbi:MAG: cation diffusion facilitator family transporter [Thermodesulfobacteriota bacterium]|nr:cation diffusion facilitator family transporter [Thermodesulfobacteriota bacterium]
MAHNHDHSAHGPISPVDSGHPVYRRNLMIALIITGSVMVAEVIGGILADSLALLSDAGHMLTDMLALGLSFFAVTFARRPPTASKTYGFYRLEILAAFFNGMLLFFIAFYILYEAYHRLFSPREVNSLFMIGVATIGLVSNIVGVIILKESAQDNLNVKSAFFHMISDTVSSLGVIGGGILIFYTGWFVVDPIISVLISLLIFRGALSLLRESIDILLEATPKGIDAEKLLAEIRSVKGVKDVHHMHLWTITSGVYAMSAHILIDDLLTSKSARILKEIERLLKAEFSMEHTTIQFESSSCGEDMLPLDSINQAK